jgi:protein-glutamine gamma-glutamyltransferase
MKSAIAQRPTLVVLAAFTLAVLLHVDRVPPWCVAVAAIALAWHWLHVIGRLQLPGNVLRLLIAGTLCAATLATFRTVQGLGAGSALLLVMGSAKLLEVRKPRDAMVVTLVSLVLLVAACLDRQSLSRLPLYLLAGWTACAAIAALGDPGESNPLRRAFRTSGIALLAGLPFAIACFALVPRLPGPLWGIPRDEQARTGLDDQMSPGSISELSISDAPAFRVRFEGAAPPPSARYWRGPVLHDFDGYTWRRLRQAIPAPAMEPLGEEVRYRILLEPHGRNWVYGLDTIRTINAQRSFRTYDGQVLTTRPVTSVTAYDGISSLRVRYPGPLSTTGRRLDTRLAPGRNPRSLELATRMRAESADDRDYTRRVLEMFRSGGFRYTLTPPLLDYDSVDDLLFNTRLGFCGHYASAYVSLMRAAGVPARVVTGYLGGEWNAIGGYYLVRQADAHAWAEVWLDGEGWVRIDPTAVVAPERLELGLRDLMPDRGPASSRLLRSATWMRNLAAAWDATGNWWQERIVRFNMASQMDLMRRLGLGDIDYRGMAIVLLGAAALWAVVIALWTARVTPGIRPDELGAAWLRFVSLLRRRGMTVAAHEPPRAIARRAAMRFPGVAGPVDEFAAGYLQLRYGAGPRATASQVRSLLVLLDRIARGIAAPRRPRTTATTKG